MSSDNLAVSPDRPEPAGSLRLRVARAALQAALRAPGVAGAAPGPSGLCVTPDPPAGALVGVSATAQADGRYAVDLSLVAAMVPLPELAEQVRERVCKRARDERLDEMLGSINVDFAYVVTAEELAAATAEQEAEVARAAEQIAPAAAAAEQARAPSPPESVPVSGAVAEAVAARGKVEPAPGGETAVVAHPTELTPAGRDAAALAVRQAALATDQAALAAKQAALAAEQAALAAGPGTPGPRRSTERATEEREG